MDHEAVRWPIFSEAKKHFGKNIGEIRSEVFVLLAATLTGLFLGVTLESIRAGLISGLISLIGFVALLFLWSVATAPGRLWSGQQKELDELRKRLDQPHNGERVKADRQLLQELQSLLPSSSVIHFLKNQDFRVSYYWSNIEPLLTFLRHWGNPEKEFLNDELNAQLSNLYSYINTFIDIEALSCFDDNRPSERQDVFDSRSLRRRISPEWTQELRREAQDKLATAADRVVHEHQELVKAGRRILIT